MDYKNDMNEFIRETLRSSRRIRDKNFFPIQNTVASSGTSSSTFSETQFPLVDTMRVRGDLLVGGGGGAGGTFLASLVVDEDGMVTGINVTAGSYHILNTNTDVDATSGDGKYVYAIIEHSNAGIFKEFKIEISQDTKDPTNMDPTDKFVQFSNILLAEGMVVDEKPKMIQRRVGNLSLVHQVISGHICLWAYSSGGTSL